MLMAIGEGRVADPERPPAQGRLDVGPAARARAVQRPSRQKKKVQNAGFEPTTLTAEGYKAYHYTRVTLLCGNVPAWLLYSFVLVLSERQWGVGIS